MYYSLKSNKKQVYWEQGVGGINDGEEHRRHWVPKKTRKPKKTPNRLNCRRIDNVSTLKTSPLIYSKSRISAKDNRKMAHTLFLGSFRLNIKLLYLFLYFASVSRKKENSSLSILVATLAALSSGIFKLESINL